MGSRDQTPAHEITPPAFLDEHLDEFDAGADRVADVTTDQLAEALRLAERQKSTTDYDTMPRCPECLSPRLLIKSQSAHTPEHIKGAYGCHDCGANFDEPRDPLAECPLERAWKWLLEGGVDRKRDNDIMRSSSDFEWMSYRDLTDPAERGMDPLFAGVGEKTRIALAIVLYRPLSDGDTTYPAVAELLGYSDSWVGYRVREWRAGEHRDLVEAPGPTVDDASSDATALATDGGRRRRWSAFGT